MLVLTVSCPLPDTLLDDRCGLDSENVVYESPYPNGYCGVLGASRYLDVYLLLASNGLPVGSSLYESGICPTFTGNDMGSLPPGSFLPNRVSATASPPSVPGYQDSSKAGALSASQPMVSGRPFISTTTYGLPVWAICCTSASCWPGRSRFVREEASPLSDEGSPTTTTVTAAEFAALTAAPN